MRAPEPSQVTDAGVAAISVRAFAEEPPIQPKALRSCAAFVLEEG
jgi:hypothetical protein